MHMLRPCEPFAPDLLNIHTFLHRQICGDLSPVIFHILWLIFPMDTMIFRWTECEGMVKICTDSVKMYRTLAWQTSFYSCFNINCCIISTTHNSSLQPISSNLHIFNHRWVSPISTNTRPPNHLQQANLGLKSVRQEVPSTLQAHCDQGFSWSLNIGNQPIVGLFMLFKSIEWVFLHHWRSVCDILTNQRLLVSHMTKHSS